MDKKIKKEIIKLLKEKGSYLFRYQIYKQIDFPNEKVEHILDIMLDDKLVKITPSSLDGLINEDITNYIELTSKGYNYIKPWYRKMLNFMTNDLIKILTLVSIVLSIIATYISITK